MNDYTALRKEYPRTWRIFYRMNKRCNDNLQDAYVEVKVCDDWNKDVIAIENAFINFLDDMGPCENPDLSIDRINPLGDYEPGNCRWVDRTTQSYNSRFHATDERGKEVKKAIANGITNHCFYARIKRGWNIVDAYTLPMTHKKYKDRLC